MAADHLVATPPHDTADSTANEETVRQLFSAFTGNDAGAMDELLAPDFVGHGLPSELGLGAAALKASMAMMHAGLENCQSTIEDVVAEGDRVAVRYTVRAKHVRELLGAPATGRTVTLTGIEIYRVAAGKVAEYWGEANLSDLFAAG